MTPEQTDKMEITAEMVQKKLKDLNPNKSPGPDKLHPKLLKELNNELSLPLSIIFTKSLEEGRLPHEWKTANVTAIFKKGQKKKASNYRPVSLTSIPCKMIEGFVRDHLMNHMITNDLLSPSQFGFIKGRSTSLQLLNVMNAWTKILDEGHEVDSIYLDFKKAFDTVPHARLQLFKMEKYGFSREMINWVRDFLSERSHKVIVNGTESSSARVTSGIPQGSVLGPILFVLYINDLPDGIKTNVMMFADDTKVYNDTTVENGKTDLKHDLKELEDWSRKWLLEFHPDKCVVLDIGKSRPSEPYQLSDTILRHEKTEKDLGVVTDTDLTFRAHIDEKTKTANKVAGVIRRSFKHLDETIYKKLFVSLVRPHLEYCQAIWSPQIKADIEKVENVQKRSSKCIPGLKDLSYEERLRKLNLPTLVYRRHRGDMIEVYKILNHLYDSKVSKILTMRSDVVTTDRGKRGHKHMLYAEKSHKNIRKHFFSNRVVPLWNSLPDNVIESPNLNIFKNRLDACWKDQDMKFNFKATYNFRKIVKDIPDSLS